MSYFLINRRRMLLSDLPAPSGPIVYTWTHVSTTAYNQTKTYDWYTTNTTYPLKLKPGHSYRIDWVTTERSSSQKMGISVWYSAGDKLYDSGALWSNSGSVTMSCPADHTAPTFIRISFAVETAAGTTTLTVTEDPQ